MKRLSVRAARPLKVAHLAFIILWVGGLAAWVPLVQAGQWGGVDGTRGAYLHMRAIAWNIIGWGGVGSFLTGLAIGGFSTWGLFKRKWVVAKLVLTMGGIAFGIFFVERHMLDGLAMLEVPAFEAARFLANHRALQLGIACQLILLLTILGVAVLKPGDPMRELDG